MIKWTPYELHTHTNHSDGKHTLEELASSARELGLKGFAMTDHNTISTFSYLDEQAKKNNINIIKGLEWTTFYGHVVLLGISEYVDWRDVTKENFNEKVEQAKKKSRLLGIAHPYRIGGAIATGCNFEYEVKNWNLINYIEVWSGMMASTKHMNKRAFDLWTRLLNEGYKISAVSGRDWHKSTEQDKGIAATYIGLGKDEENSDENILNSLEKGKIVVSMGPLVNIYIENEGQVINIGDTVDKVDLKNRLNLSVDIYDSQIDNKNTIDESTLKVVINSNLKEIKALDVAMNSNLKETKELGTDINSNSEGIKELDIDVNGNSEEIKALDVDTNTNSQEISTLESKEISVDLSKEIENIKWVRAELYAEVNGINTMVAFTNPIYFS